jgi:ADP-heptose:LPS heptosyltransferase
LKSNPEKVLLINFGQLGDVILSLPAMHAVASGFDGSHITALVGKATAEIVHLSGLFDNVIEVDRVKLLRGPRLRSTLEIFALARDVRRRRFDLVIDLHSLPETNLLGFVSGAPLRLFANREGRSIDRLSNLRPKPPAEDKSINVTLNYLRSVEPLGISIEYGPPRLIPKKEDGEHVNEFLPKRSDRFTVALNPGAGHESRRWDLSNFAELARLLAADPLFRVVVLLGPEENDLRARVSSEFPENIIVPPSMSLSGLAAVLERTDLIVSNDTGVMHLAAAMGVKVIVLMLESAPERFLPYFGSVEVLKGKELCDITVGSVFSRVTGFSGLHHAEGELPIVAN